MAVVPIFVEQMDPFWSYVGMFANGSTGSALALGHFSVLVRRREGSGGPLSVWGPFSVATRQRKKFAGSALALGPQCWFGSRLNRFRRPARVCVLSVFKGDTYWDTGRSSRSLLLCGGVQWDLCWGAGSISIPLIRFRIFLSGPPNTEQTPVNILL